MMVEHQPEVLRVLLKIENKIKAEILLFKSCPLFLVPKRISGTGLLTV